MVQCVSRFVWKESDREKGGIDKERGGRRERERERSADAMMSLYADALRDPLRALLFEPIVTEKRSDRITVTVNGPEK